MATSFVCEETQDIVVYTVLPLPIVVQFQDSTAATYKVAVEVDCRVGE